MNENNKTAPAQPSAAPEGWKLTPSEATLAMKHAAVEAANRNDIAIHGNDLDVLYRAMLAAAPTSDQQAGAQPVAPMCERKTADIEQRGYAKTGYVLKQDGERICVSDSGAVAWFTKDEWNWLMFNRDHVEFAWPKPIGHLAAPTPDADQDALDAKRYRWLRAADWDEIRSLFWAPSVQNAGNPESCMQELDAAIDASILAAIPVTDQAAPKQGKN